jgi:hypothetical protein
MTETYNEREYPTRSFNLRLEGEAEIITIATEALFDALTDDGAIPIAKLPREAALIDENIHYYVSDEEFKLKADELCALLFEEHEFISEEL